MFPSINSPVTLMATSDLLHHGYNPPEGSCIIVQKQPDGEWLEIRTEQLVLSEEDRPWFAIHGDRHITDFRVGAAASSFRPCSIGRPVEAAAVG